MTIWFDWVIAIALLLLAIGYCVQFGLKDFLYEKSKKGGQQVNMGFFDALSGVANRTSALSEQVAHVQLTELGENKLKDLEPTGRKFDICMVIKSKQPCSVKEISDEIHWPENKVRYVLGDLAREQWIRKV